MSAAPARLSGAGAGAHPLVSSRRTRGLLQILAAGVAPLVVALAISVEVSSPNTLLLVGIAIGVLAIVGLMSSPRYELTMLSVALYLGLLDGPVKLGIGGHEAVSAVRDVLIAAISAGALARLFTKRERIPLPPLSAWVFVYVAVVLTEAFNPNTHGLTKTLGGFRQLLEWVPFFFFGYALMRSKARFRRFFLLLGVLALANGIVGAYQTRLSPQQLAAWGPGYEEIALGAKGFGGRTYKSEGEARVRPPALGTDAGFGGGLGVLALPATLALFAFRRRKRWAALLLCFGAMMATATGLGRLQLVGAITAVLAFGGLSLWMLLPRGPRVALRPLAAIGCVLVLAIPAGVLFVSLVGSSTFSRYESIVKGGHSDNKLPGLTRIPNQLTKEPFGFGLGIAGAAAGFGGLSGNSESGETHNPDAETQYNFLADELGVFGLLVSIGFTIRLLWLSLPRLKRIRDTELLLYMTALLSSFIAMTVMGFYGPTLASEAFGPFLWFFAGTASYWFLGPGREALRGAETPRARPLALAGAGMS
ncbi:MAG TPA: hypothetical protein VGY13_07225 [Solirubrobacteraceae bacterium]|jgi:hypothetical protein|nr:hypothetical protein [Solirubrobacteraceae bacterium]